MPSRDSRVTLERGLARHGIPLLGVLPYRPILSNPTLAMVLEGVHGEALHPVPDLDRVIGGVAIGAMEPEHMLQRIGPRSLVIVPGDRDDVIRRDRGRPDVDGRHGAMRTGALGTRPDRRLPPGPAVIDAIRRADLFATLVPEDTYAVASEVHDLLVKTHAVGRGKIAEIKELVWRAPGHRPGPGGVVREARGLTVVRAARCRSGGWCRSGPPATGAPGRRRASSSRACAASATETYSGSARGSAASVSRIAARSASADRSPASQRRRAASSARRRTGAAARSAGERWTFRDDRASPSGSRTVGQAMTSRRDGEVDGPSGGSP